MQCLNDEEHHCVLSSSLHDAHVRQMNALVVSFPKVPYSRHEKMSPSTTVRKKYYATRRDTCQNTSTTDLNPLNRSLLMESVHV